MNYATAATQNGILTHAGIEYALLDNAYAENYGTDNQVRYYANAIDGAGVKYKVTWETVAYDCTDLPDDESMACDWDKPISIAVA
jgi:hypothetical protein